MGKNRTTIGESRYGSKGLSGLFVFGLGLFLFLLFFKDVKILCLLSKKKEPM